MYSNIGLILKEVFMRTAIINLSLPKSLLGKVDREALKEDRSRSELMRVAVQSYLDRRTAWDKIFAYGNGLAKRKKLKPSSVAAAIAEVRKPHADNR
jgi:metal-responsive CopG/Arc/MetJ family transcriptional regulator